MAVKNETKNLALLKRFVAINSKGEEINPIFWSDNFITLFPGEQCELQAIFAIQDAGDGIPVIKMED